MVGVDDEVGSIGSVVFQVFVDGVLRYVSGIMTGATASKSVSVSLTSGATELRSSCTDAGDGPPTITPIGRTRGSSAHHEVHCESCMKRRPERGSARLESCRSRCGPQVPSRHRLRTAVTGSDHGAQVRCA